MNNGSLMAILTYANLRKEDTPRQALLDFMECAYQGGAEFVGWPIEDFKVPDLDKL